MIALLLIAGVGICLILSWLAVTLGIWLADLVERIENYFWVRRNFPKDWRLRWKRMYYK